MEISEPGTSAASIPTFADPVRLLGRSHAGLQVGKLHLLPQPVDNVIDLEFEQELDFALVLATLALLARPPLLGGIRKYIAWLGFALTGSLLLLGAPQPEVIVFEHPDGDAHSARALVDDIRAGNNLRQMLANRLADLLIVPQPVTRTA